MIAQYDRQPLCRCCAKPIRKHVRTVYVHRESDGITEAGMRPNDFARHICVPEPLRTKADCQRHTNLTVVSVRRSYVDASTIGSFGEWDGRSYVDPYFCTGACAQTLGYVCAKEGRVTNKYNEAIKAK